MYDLHIYHLIHIYVFHDKILKIELENNEINKIIYFIGIFQN